MRQIIVFVLCAFFASVSRANEDGGWQYAKWGMTPEQVITASNGVASPVQTQLVRARSYPDSTCILREGINIQQPTAVWNLDVSFCFSLSSGRLVRVTIDTPQRDEALCQLQYKQLLEMHGSPSIVTTPYSREWKWKNNVGTTAITFVSVHAPNRFCKILYDEIPVASH